MYRSRKEHGEVQSGTPVAMHFLGVSCVLSTAFSDDFDLEILHLAVE